MECCAQRMAARPGRMVKALAVSPTQPGTLYAGTKPACLFISHTGGRHWDELVAFRRIRARWLWFSPAENPFTAYVQAIALSPTDPQTVLVGIEFGAVVQSRDGATPGAAIAEEPCGIAMRSPSIAARATGSTKRAALGQASR